MDKICNFDIVINTCLAAFVSHLSEKCFCLFVNKVDS